MHSKQALYDMIQQYHAEPVIMLKIKIHFNPI